MRTTNAILVSLVKALCEQYAAQIDAMPIKPAVRGALKDGFTDGARTGVFKCAEMLGVEIES